MGVPLVIRQSLRINTRIRQMLERAYWLPGSLLALVLGLRGRQSVPLWVDELFTVRSVQEGFGGSVDGSLFVPFNTVIYFATGGGKCLTESCLRLPSLFSVVLAVALTAKTARLVATPAAGMYTGVLLSVTPSILRAAHDARPYAVATSLIAVTTLLLVFATSRRHVTLWIGYAVALALAALIMPTTLAVVAGHGFWLLVARSGEQRILLYWLGSIGLTGLLLITPASKFSWLGSADPNNRQVDLFFPGLADPLRALTMPFDGGFYATAGFGVFAGAVAVLALSNRQALTWFVAGLASIGSLWLVSWFTATVWVGRYAVPFVSLFVIAAGIGLSRLSVKKQLVGLSVFLVAAIPAYQENLLPWGRGYDWRSAMAIVADRWQEGDHVVPDPEMGKAGRWAVEYYGDSNMRIYEGGTQVGGRLWTFNQEDLCDASLVFDLGSGSSLRLCDHSIRTKDDPEHP